MKFKFTSRGATFTDKKQDKAQELISRLEKFYSKEVVCSLTLSKIADGCIKLDARLTQPGDFILASSEGEDYDTVVNDVYEKLKKQLRREKDKRMAELSF